MLNTCIDIWCIVQPICIHFHSTYIFAAISWHFDAEPENNIFCVKNKYVQFLNVN